MYVVEKDIWVEVRPGTTQKLHRRGDRISDEEAERLGLKKAPEPANKKAPAPANKRAPRPSNKTPKE